MYFACVCRYFLKMLFDLPMLHYLHVSIKTWQYTKDLCVCAGKLYYIIQYTDLVYYHGLYSVCCLSFMINSSVEPLNCTVFGDLYGSEIFPPTHLQIYIFFYSKRVFQWGCLLLCLVDCTCIVLLFSSTELFLFVHCVSCFCNFFSLNDTFS